MAKPAKRSLYQCFQAKVKGDRIGCAKEHMLTGQSKGTVNIERLVRGEPLELTVCQTCPDYDEMGPPIPKGERGWIEEVQ